MACPAVPIPLLPADAVPEGQTHKFATAHEGRPAEAFLLRFNGELHAYLNLCRHLPVSLDYDDNRFFHRDGHHLVCQTHGAMFHPSTGLCTRGPCQGQSLHRLNIEVRNGMVWLLPSPSSPSPSHRT